MHSNSTYTDVARDPCAIIARSCCGTAVFFASYLVLALTSDSTQQAFWPAFGLGLIGCLIIGRKPDPRFLLPLAVVAFATGDLIMTATNGLS